MRLLTGFLISRVLSLGSDAPARVLPSAIDALPSKFESVRDLTVIGLANRAEVDAPAIAGVRRSFISGDGRRARQVVRRGQDRHSVSRFRLAKS